MSAFTRNLLIGVVIGWPALVYGWVTDQPWVLGAAGLLFLLLTIERLGNRRRDRRSGGA